MMFDGETTFNYCKLLDVWCSWLEIARRCRVNFNQIWVAWGVKCLRLTKKNTRPVGPEGCCETWMFLKMWIYHDLPTIYGNFQEGNLDFKPWFEQTQVTSPERGCSNPHTARAVTRNRVECVDITASLRCHWRWFSFEQHEDVSCIETLREQTILGRFSVSRWSFMRFCRRRDFWVG